ncbi:hypothetical protein PFISCL1PPCAC_20410, partial [Pristionchus fissidentatus]
VMKQTVLVLLFVLLVTALGEQMTTVRAPEASTSTNSSGQSGFFSTAINYIEMGLKRIFGFKDDSINNSTSVAGESELLRALSKSSTDKTQQLLTGGSGSLTTVTPPPGVIVVKEDATTQRKH